MADYFARWIACLALSIAVLPNGNEPIWVGILLFSTSTFLVAAACIFLWHDIRETR